MMVLRLNKLAESIVFLHTGLLMPRTKCRTFYTVYSTPRVLSTQQEKSSFHCPEF